MKKVDVKLNGHRVNEKKNPFTFNMVYGGMATAEIYGVMVEAALNSLESRPDKPTHKDIIPASRTILKGEEHWPLDPETGKPIGKESELRKYEFGRYWNNYTNWVRNNYKTDSGPNTDTPLDKLMKALKSFAKNADDDQWKKGCELMVSLTKSTRE